VNAEERRALLLASIDLQAATLTPDSHDRPILAALRTTTETLADPPGDSRLLRVVLAAIAEATAILERIPTVLGPDGPVSQLLHRQSAALADAGRVGGLTRGREKQVTRAEANAAKVRACAAEGLSQGQTHIKTGLSRKTVYRYWPKS